MFHVATRLHSEQRHGARSARASRSTERISGVVRRPRLWSFNEARVGLVVRVRGVGAVSWLFGDRRSLAQERVGASASSTRVAGARRRRVQSPAPRPGRRTGRRTGPSLGRRTGRRTGGGRGPADGAKPCRSWGGGRGQALGGGRGQALQILQADDREPELPLTCVRFLIASMHAPSETTRPASQPLGDLSRSYALYTRSASTGRSRKSGRGRKAGAYTQTTDREPVATFDRKHRGSGRRLRDDGQPPASPGTDRCRNRHGVERG